MRKSRKTLAEAFGLNEAGLPDLPPKIGNIRVSRLVFNQVRGGCSHCFPHGIETTNCAFGEARKSWKRRRRTQLVGPR